MLGKFISIDGLDGCGKSTQIDLLQAWLTERGHNVLCVRDPGGTALGEALREILLHRSEIPLVPTSEMLLYMASRAQLVAEKIKPALEAGRMVLSDRFLIANVVYQGHGGGLAPEAIWKVGEIATAGLQPDHTFILDIKPEIAAGRVGQEKDRLESRGIEYMARVREGYLAESCRLQGRLTVLDADDSPDSLHHQVLQVLAAQLGIA